MHQQAKALEKRLAKAEPTADRVRAALKQEKDIHVTVRSTTFLQGPRDTSSPEDRVFILVYGYVPTGTDIKTLRAAAEKAAGDIRLAWKVTQSDKPPGFILPPLPDL